MRIRTFLLLLFCLLSKNSYGTLESIEEQQASSARPLTSPDEIKTIIQTTYSYLFANEDGYFPEFSHRMINLHWMNGEDIFKRIVKILENYSKFKESDFNNKKQLVSAILLDHFLFNRALYVNTKKPQCLKSKAVYDLLAFYKGVAQDHYNKENNTCFFKLSQYKRNQVFKLHQALSHSFLEYQKHDKPWTLHIPTFGSLAAGYMRIFHPYLPCDDEGQNVALEFASEIVDRAQRNQTTYEWFLLFTHRLITFMTPQWQIDQYSIKYNLPFDAYQHELRNYQVNGQPCYRTHEAFLKASNTVSSLFTQRFASPHATAREFPFVAQLPFPFEMSAWDVLTMFPSPVNSFVPCMYALPYAMPTADGSEMPLDIGYSHEKAHTAIAKAMMTRSGVSIKPTDECWAQILSKDHIQQHWDHLLKTRHVFYQYLFHAQSFLEDLPAQSRFRRKLYSLFHLIIFHEGMHTIDSRLNWLQNPNQFKELVLSDTGLKIFMNPKYYKPLLPFSLQKLEVQPLKKKLSQLIDGFYKNFSEYIAPYNLQSEYSELRFPKSPEGKQNIASYFSKLPSVCYHPPESNIATAYNQSLPEDALKNIEVYYELTPKILEDEKLPAPIITFTFNDHNWTCIEQNRVMPSYSIEITFQKPITEQYLDRITLQISNGLQKPAQG